MRSNSLSLMLLFVFAVFAQPLFGETKDFDLYNHDNIVAWCIVPFDSKKRGPEERAAMLKELGVKRLAYDYRAEHVPTFDDELNALKENGIELTAWWFPGALNDEAKMTLELFKRHNVHPQLWISGGGGPANSPEEQQQRVNAEAARLKPIAEAAAEVGCKVALYNHGGWFGGPENQIEIIKELNLNNVGIVYNLHHGHEHLDRFEALLQEMKPYLLALNLNGMVPEGDQHGQKIVPLGAGELDLQLLSIIAKSGWQGPIGILDHDTSVDTRLRLQDNLNGLDWLVKQLKGETAGPRPEYQSWTSPFKVSESTSSDPSVYDQTLVAQYVKSASEQGNAEAGLAIFTSAKSACISCHKLGEHGGTVGPELTKIGVERKPREIVESIFWPKKDVKPEYVSHTIITDEGKIHTGYLTNSTGEERTLKNPATGELTTFAVDEIDEQIPGSTLMPDGLTTAMSKQQQLDLIKFVSTLGTNEAVSLDKVGEMMARMHVHGPAEFEYNRDPLFPTDWPNWQAHINRDRLYDFYAKEAEHFRQEKSVPHLLPEFPGLDGGEFGHWGNQTEQSWADDRWNETKLGSVQSGIFHHGDLTIPRAVCVQLGEENELSVCFDTDTLSYPVVWKDGFVKFSSVRHGFMHGLLLDGTLFASHQPVPPAIQYKYLGFFRHGKQVVFHFRVGDQEYYDIPRLISGTFGRTTILADQVSKSDLAYLLEPGELQWPQILETPITKGAGSPYVVDDIAIPFENPWNALFFCGGHDFLPDGRALVCTMQGDVWLVDGFQNGGTRAKWKRFASGLHHSLGLVVHEGAIYVQGRDQITRLYDHNNDGEADQYECFSKAYTTSSAGHDFICGLQRDADGNFYTASGNEGLLRISPDGEKVEVLATGFRNPDGLGLTPDGLLTVPCSEGEWTPSSMICGIRRRPGSKTENENSIPFFGYKKLARHDQSVEEPPALPLVYLPRGLDNSSGGQTYINSDQWGPLQGEVLHFSYGTGSHFLLLRDEVNGQLQGGVVPLPGEFLSGAHRGRFHPLDG
ncbi:MAG: TIM barrel protein, partial [Planctomycetaceae bacterium]|nr:TIM barrel protein [Planctomycetaceae bacterium]